MDAPPYSAILRVDENDPEGPTPCQSLRISYKDPRFHDLLTEEVFLDPRDTLLGDNGLLLVNAAGVTALQQKSDREHRWAQSAQTTIGSCRRDYLREQQYLLGELTRLQAIAQNAPKMVEKDIAELMESAMKSAEQAAQDPASLVSEDDIQYLAEVTGGTRISPGDDDELLEVMSNMGLDKEDELTSRILLQKIRADTTELFQKRHHVRAAVEAVEGKDEKGNEDEGLKVLVEELLKQAEKEDADRRDIIDALLQKAESPEQHKAIEDTVTKGLRIRYDTMFGKYQELEPKVVRWRETLELNEEKAAQQFYLSKEVNRLEEEAEQRAEEERRNERKDEEEQAAKAAAARAAAEAKKREEANPDDLQNSIIDKLDAEVQAKIKEEQHQVNVNKRRADKVREEIVQILNQVNDFNARRDAVRASIAAAESEYANAEEAMAESEERNAHFAELFRRVSVQEVEAKQRREVLEDELAASKRPPPKEKDARKLETEVEAARSKNGELREHEEQLYERERQYEARFEETELAWKAYQEEEAAMALMAELEASERSQQTYEVMAEIKPQLRTMDPMLLDYKDRQFLPEYSEAARFNLLHMDNRARDRRISKTRRGVAEDKAEQHLAKMRSTESEMAASSSSGPKSQVPLNFRRPEDVKVRLRGAERNVGNMAGDLAERGAHGAKVAEDLHHLGRRLAASAAESSRIHSDIPQRFASFLQGDGLPSSVLRDQLVHALQDHQVCMSRAEDAWRLAEAGCTRGVPEEEMELEQEACARCEDDLISAARGLYSTARQAARDGPGEVAPHAERCCEDWDAAEPELSEAATVRNRTWPEILSLTCELAEAREAQAHLNRHLKAEERRKNLLDAERSAPPAARRALAAMRAATSTTSRLGSALLE